MGVDVNTPHFSSDPGVAAAVHARMTRTPIADPIGAVRFCLTRGLRIDEADIEIPFTEQLRDLSGVMAAEFRLSHAAELQAETQALRLARASTTLIAQRIGAAAAQTAADLEAAIERRTDELVVADDAARRARFREQARRELAPAPTNETTPRAKARTTERTAAR